MIRPPSVLAFDFASPDASAALAREGEVLAAVDRPRPAGGDEDLLRLVAETLAAADLARSDLGGIVALRGPGSFTGLRIACATAIGLADALGVPATAVPTLEALALRAPKGSGRVLAAVDALRGEWYVQRFERDEAARALDEPRLVPADALPTDVRLAVGFGLAGRLPAGSPCLTPDRLAVEVARLASLGRWDWDAEALRHPLYLRAPATTRPR